MSSSSLWTRETQLQSQKAFNARSHRQHYTNVTTPWHHTHDTIHMTPWHGMFVTLDPIEWFSIQFSALRECNFGSVEFHISPRTQHLSNFAIPAKNNIFRFFSIVSYHTRLRTNEILTKVATNLMQVQWPAQRHDLPSFPWPCYWGQNPIQRALPAKEEANEWHEK